MDKTNWSGPVETCWCALHRSVKSASLLHQWEEETIYAFFGEGFKAAVECMRSVCDAARADAVEREVEPGSDDRVVGQHQQQQQMQQQQQQQAKQVLEEECTPAMAAAEAAAAAAEALVVEAAAAEVTAAAARTTVAVDADLEADCDRYLLAIHADWIDRWDWETII